LVFLTLLFSITLSPSVSADVIWQGDPTPVTYKVTAGVPTIDEGEIYSEALPNGLTIKGSFRIMTDPDGSVVDFSLHSVRLFMYTGGEYTTTASGSASFSATPSNGVVTNFSIYNASIYTQDGFVTPAPTAAASKPPGAVSLKDSPTITLVTDTTKAWTLTAGKGYELTDDLLIVCRGLTEGELVSIDFPANATINPVPEPSTVTLFGVALSLQAVHGWRRKARRRKGAARSLPAH
jgi:hypothetical protein